MTKPVRRFSVKRRLLFMLLAAITVAWLITVLMSYRDAKRQVDALLDAHLAQAAALLAAQIGGETHEEDDHGEEGEEIDTDELTHLHQYSHEVVFQIWQDGRRLLLYSANAPRERLASQEMGFSDAVHGGEPWRVFSLWSGTGRQLIQVGERHEVRERIVGSLAERLLQPLLIALPGLAVLIWFGVTHALTPLTTLSTQVTQRDPENLTPLEATEAPVEVAPLVENLNRLFARMRNSLDNERRFTADAAHELRTPLAALKIQAQVARTATIDSERRRALDNVIVGSDRAAHLVEQLLTLARLEPGQSEHLCQHCDLRSVVTMTVAELAPLALHRHIELELDPGCPVSIDGNPELLRILLRNLIDNAMRYSPSGSVVRVAVTPERTQVVLSVTDQGPGLAPEEREKVWQRFYRILGSGEVGSGLGLSIVKRIAEIHGAVVSLDEGDHGQGLRVTVIFRHPEAG